MKSTDNSFLGFLIFPIFQTFLISCPRKKNKIFYISEFEQFQRNVLTNKVSPEVTKVVLIHQKSELILRF